MPWHQRQRQAITCVYNQCDHGEAVMSVYSMFLIANNNGTQVFAPMFITHRKREKNCKTVAHIKCLHPEKAVNTVSDFQRKSTNSFHFITFKIRSLAQMLLWLIMPVFASEMSRLAPLWRISRTRKGVSAYAASEWSGSHTVVLIISGLWNWRKLSLATRGISFLSKPSQTVKTFDLIAATKAGLNV